MAAAIGLLAWLIVIRADLVLTHYDAKAHLVVARRVIDNITPGWQQIGAVWLPLPHLLQILPTQIDLMYRTGAFGSVISIVSFTAMAYATARLVLAITGSTTGAAAGVALLALNPNLLYLQATPMTEPLLLGVTFLVVLWAYEWVAAEAGRVPPRLDAALFAATWTRYEAWLIVAAVLMGAAYVLARRGRTWRGVAHRTLRLAVFPIIAGALFVVNSRITVGEWFVTGGFYVADPMYQGRAVKTVIALWWGTHEMSGYLVTAVALVTAVSVAVRSLVRRTEAASLMPLALLAAGALPFYAFFSGHPFRIRYMIPLVAASALLAGLGVGWLRRSLAPPAAILLGLSVVLESPFWTGTAPLIAEAQWDVPASLNRRVVTECLRTHYHGEKVLASMGSLAHYMQELASAGFDIADFINEGNGVIWEAAIQSGPAPHAGWMLVEEQAEGGDVLAGRIREHPSFARDMVRVCEGGGVALYRRATASRAATR